MTAERCEGCGRLVFVLATVVAGVVMDVVYDSDDETGALLCSPHTCGECEFLGDNAEGE